MHHQAQFPGMFEPVQGVLNVDPPVPATQKQIDFAISIAGKVGLAVPKALFRDKTLMSRWIDGNKPR